MFRQYNTRNTVKKALFRKNRTGGKKPKDIAYTYSMKTIVLTGGGTAGHITPNLALLPYLKKSFDRIVYIGGKTGMEKELAEKHGIPFYGVSCAKLVRKFTLKNLTIPAEVLRGISEAGRILDQEKPNVIFSKGGYVCLPVVFAAKKRKIPVLSHESDYTTGLANKIAARYSATVLTSFPQTAKTVKNGVCVGAPLRNELRTADKEYALRHFRLSGKKPVLLVTGGSLGAKAINDAVRADLPELCKTFDVIHVCGRGNKSGIVREGYTETEFTDRMDLAFAAADVAVSRAGSNTVFELAATKIPALLIPLPKGVSRGDQILNAEYFESKGYARVLFQERLTPKTLYDEVFKIYSEREKYLKRFSVSPVSSACSKIADMLIRYAK